MTFSIATVLHGIIIGFVQKEKFHVFDVRKKCVVGRLALEGI
jgi:hypothetical protein